MQVSGGTTFFKIDDVSREIRTKKATIKEWERQWQLRETYLEAPAKLYTASDIDFFKSFKRLTVDEKIEPALALKQLPTKKKAQTITPSKSTITHPARRIKDESENEEEDEGEPLEIELELDMDFKNATEQTPEQQATPIVQAATSATAEMRIEAKEVIPAATDQIQAAPDIVVSPMVCEPEPIASKIPEPAFEPATRPSEITPAHKTVTITIDDLNKIREQAIKIREKLKNDLDQLG